MTSLQQLQPFNAGGVLPREAVRCCAPFIFLRGRLHSSLPLHRNPTGCWDGAVSQCHPICLGILSARRASRWEAGPLPQPPPNRLALESLQPANVHLSRDCSALVSSCGVIPAYFVRSFPWVITFSPLGERERTYSPGKYLWKNNG